MRFLFFSCLFVFGFICTVLAQRISYSPPEFRLTTPWTMDVNLDQPLSDYPRPQMVRPDWRSLNGRWYFAVTSKDDPVPEKFDREIIVPFPIESALSGIQQQFGPESKYWYKRTFFIPDQWSGKFVQLHFGGCDWETTVFINGKEIGKHRGGYDPFVFDISPYLDERGVQEIIISVWDPTNAHFQPRGKQRVEPKGIWYTPVSGIWQTVWMEPVNVSYVKSIQITPDLDQSKVAVQAEIENAILGDTLLARISKDGNEVAQLKFAYDQTGVLSIPAAMPWTPQSPQLYDIELELIRKKESIDAIRSYTGMRKIELKKDKNGVQRIYLNNQPIFQLGLLDQGWWPDGLYTAPTDEALQFDIVKSKEMGYNVIRKHVKVEPARWYYHCDRLGMLVWQDMPNGDKNAEWKPPSGIDGVEMTREFVSEAQYKIEFEAIIKANYNHPSIVKWIPFNEGWGQFKTEEIFDWVATLDTTRLLGGPSGGNYFPVGDTRDHHKYPGPELPIADPARALILGEFGGLGFPEEGHLWQSDKNWGYVNIKSQKKLIEAYNELIIKLIPMLDQSLTGAIYTQTTDVEGEINGTMTYDRKVVKLTPKKVRKVHEQLFEKYNEVTE